MRVAGYVLCVQEGLQAGADREAFVASQADQQAGLSLGTILPPPRCQAKC